MDAGNFKILKYNGEGVDPGAFDGTGTGDQPLVISASKTKERNSITQEMILKETDGSLSKKISIIQESVPLFVDGSGGATEITANYRENFSVVFSGRANGQYIRYRVDDTNRWNVNPVIFYANITSDKVNPETELVYDEDMFGSDREEGFSQVTDDFYDGGTSTYTWSVSINYENTDTQYDSGGLDPGVYSVFIDVADTPFTEDIEQGSVKTIECKINVPVPTSTVNLHWKRTAVDKMKYWVTANYSFGSRTVDVMLNNNTYTVEIPDGSSTSASNELKYTTTAAVNPAILSSDGGLYNVGSIVKEDWAFMSTPNPSSGIPNGSNLGANDVAGTSTFNLYRTSRLYYPKSSISTDTFSYEDMSPSNDYDATYTIKIFSQPNVMVETKHIIGIYKSYPGTPTDTKTIIQDAYSSSQ